MNPWIAALIGGLLIGTSATLLLWLNGRICGHQRHRAGVAVAPASDRALRIAFLAGLMLAGGLAMRYLPNAAAPRTGFPVWMLITAGLLVGYGTSLGSGCTSGHGICGLGRLSLRSLAATLTFMATGIVTVFVARHVLGVQP